MNPGPMLEVEPGADWRKVRLALYALLLVRLVSLGLYPVMDNTEARYADIGRAMLATQDWVTPWIEPGVPFWGKPPLSFWITAASLGVFGINEFAARLPHFLMALLTGWTLWGWARDQARSTGGSAPLPLMTVSLLAGACLMAVAAGAVMTDMSLVAGTTLVMRGFWQAMQETDPAQRQRQGWIFFVGLAVGLLAKGPLILVLAGLPLGLWVLSQGQLRAAWRSLPWLRGTALTLVLSVPWYWLAEIRSPGFLDYFLVGEHWHRFVTPGWAGDRYGGAHAAPRGIVWLYAFVAAMPWSVLVPVALWKWRRLAASGNSPGFAMPNGPSVVRYLVFWSLTPLVFFSFAGNILWTYVLPSLPPLALAAGLWLAGRGRATATLLAVGLWISAAGLAAFVLVLNQPRHTSLNNTRDLVAQAQAFRHPLYFYLQRPYSASFYSRGQAGVIADASALLGQSSNPPFSLAVKTEQLSRVPAEVARRIPVQRSFGDYTLLSPSVP